MTEYPRALATGDASDEEVWAVNLGKLHPYREMQKDLLRAATPLETNINNRERKKKLLRSLDVLRRRCEMSFGELVPTVVAMATDPRPVTDTPIYCESSRASLQNPGMLYEAVQMLGDSQVPGDDVMNLLLGFVASFLNIDKIEPKKHQRAAWINLACCRNTCTAYLESDV